MFDFRFCGDRWIRPRESMSLGAALGRRAVRDEQVTLARVRAIVAKHVDERQEGRGMRRWGTWRRTPGRLLRR
jgi:hypothetical protein